MDNSLNNTPAAKADALAAETLAASFQVAELEPRLENVWGDQPPIENPTGGTGLIKSR